MFSGFHPQGAAPFFERRLGTGLLAALALHVVVLGYAAYASQGGEQAVVAELGDEPIEEVPPPEEPEDEPEEEEEVIEEEPEDEAPIEDPNPSPTRPRMEPVVQETVTPTEIDDSDLDKSADGPKAPVEQQTGTGGTGPVGKPTEKPTQDASDDKPKPTGPKLDGDPNEPRKSAPEGATPAKPKSGNNAPEYPAPCRKRSIEGKYSLMLHIDREGKVKGVKVVKKWNSAEGDDAAKAHKLFLKAIETAIKTWKYTPAKYGKTTFAVWKRVSIPFTLKN